MRQPGIKTWRRLRCRRGEDADAKLVQKNGQISNLSVGQADAETEKEDAPEKMEELKGEADPQVEVMKQEKESAGTDELTSVDKVGEEEKPSETNEVGFKKIFRFVGFKVTLKKDKNEKNEPVQLLTVKKEEGEASASDVAEEAATEEPEEKGLIEASKENGVVEEDKKEGAEEESTENGATEEIKPEERKETPEEPQAEEVGAESPTAEETTEKLTTDTEEQAAETEEPTEEVTSEKESDAPTESQTSPAAHETQSPLKRFFTQGIFSNLRKKTSFKKTKEEELQKEVAIKEEIKEMAEETTESPKEGEETNEETMAEAQQKESASAEESKAELLPEVPDDVVEQKEDEIKGETNAEAESPQTTLEEVAESLPTEGAADVTSTEAKAESSAEGQENQEEAPSAEVPAAITTEAELLSSQEKNKAQGSPLKKLLTGSGLKKLSSKKQKVKKEAEAKLTESGEHVSDQLQSSCESAEGQKGESSPSSPEESVEHVIGEPGQTEMALENEGEGDKKKDGILPWASFKKLVTPKKRVKKSSDSEDDAPEKPKSATLSSTDSAVFVEKQEEPKPAEEEQKTEPCTEEPKRKMDTSVSWEALICVGSSKKRARKTSDSDDDTPRIEEEQPKTAEALLGSSQEADQENLASSPEQAGSPSEGDGVSTWESLKRFVTPRRKVKVEDKAEEATAGTTSEQIPSDSEIPKEESSFSLKKLIPGRRKKKSDGKQEQVSSDEAGKSLGSAEEDSDTPAVVPLSEYDSEQVEQDNIASKDTVAATEMPVSTTEAEESKQETTVPESEAEKPIDAVPITGPQVKSVADAEERLPSWISPTAVADIQETTECIIKQPLSDIPEEGDTIATPKSIAEEASHDDTIAEDIVELTSEVTTAVEQVPEVSFTEETTEMVSAVSRLTESPGTSGDTTPVQAECGMDKTEAILLEAVQTITHTENVQSLTMTDLQQESVAVSVTPQVLESATNEEAVILQLHAKSEAAAICTGLDSQEIESAEEKPLQASVESITEVGEAVSTEVAVEEKAEKSEVATAREDCVFVAKVQELKIEAREPKPLSDVEETAQRVEVQVETVKGIQDTEVLLMGEVKHMSDHEHADMLQEPKPVKVAVVNLVQGASEVLEEPVVAENTSKTETEGPLDTTIEESLSSHIAHITEVSLVKADALQEIEAIKEDVAETEVTPLEVVNQCVIQEVTVSMPEPPTAEISDIKEASIAVVAPTAELLASNETTCVIEPLSESVPSEMAEVKDVVALESDHEVQVSVTGTEILIVEAALGAATDSVPTSIGSTAEDVRVKEEELKEMLAEQIQEAETVKEDSTAVAEAVIQSVDLKMEQVKDAGITAEDSDAVSQVVTQKVDLEVMQTEQKKEAEHVEVDGTSDAEVVSKNALDDLSKQESESGITEQEEEGKKMVLKAEREASGEKEVKGETEEPKEPVLPETVQEAVQVETIKVSQSEATESSAVLAEIHHEDIIVKPSEENIQETDVTAQENETQTQEEQAEVKQEGLATQEAVKGKDEAMLESQEEAAAVIEEKKSEYEAHEVEAESQEQSRVADITGQDDRVSETVLQKEVQHEDVQVPTTVEAEITGQTVVEPIDKEEEKQAEEDLNQGAAELRAKDDAVPVVSQDSETAVPVVSQDAETAVPVVSQDAETAVPVVSQDAETAVPKKCVEDHGDGTVSGELESQEAPAEDGMATETGDPKASDTETEAKAQNVSTGCPSATDADSVATKKTMGQTAISGVLEVTGAVILEKASELQPVSSEQTATS
ncbi:A-kinase anchor protein 12b isoform X2 [Brienomyrus brachyistius]|uniref:A-kinase anchor protein 12b isoform X2 n=1 Tax=Brienomyrus brachyistius TaxID=42636 RepID=UPI0020B2F18E|nr:A-kinase anchor protein 12b isoform X2 [Brienomyrus brachyistius]